MHICLPQSLTKATRLAIALSHCTVHVVDVYSYKMMNPSLNVYEKCLIETIFLPRDVVGLSHVILFSTLIISVQINSMLFHFDHVQIKIMRAISERGSAFMLMPCDSNHCYISANQK